MAATWPISPGVTAATASVCRAAVWRDRPNVPPGVEPHAGPNHRHRTVDTGRLRPGAADGCPTRRPLDRYVHAVAWDFAGLTDDEVTALWLHVRSVPPRPFGNK